MPVGALPVASADENGVEHRPLAVGKQYLVRRDTGPARSATILDRRETKHGSREAYISYSGEDKRLDAWISEVDVGVELVNGVEAGPSSGPGAVLGTMKRKRKAVVIAATTPRKLQNGHLDISPRRHEPGPPSSAPSTPEREHAAMTRVRNFEDVRFGEYLIKTWYYSPYPLPLEETPPMNSTPLSFSALPIGPITSNSRKRNAMSMDGDAPVPSASKPRGLGKRSASDLFTLGAGQSGEGARGRLWVCDLCFKYMRTRAGFDRHTSSCTMMQPPGRKVYQRGSYTIWEVDGAQATLYCQNLSLFGKLFIDHKSVFFHVDNFLFYALCDAATSRRDQVMAFFSKEKLSYDDYNLACIVTFPPFQNQGFGKLLIELSYYLTRHPSTSPINASPGTPERPLSDLGLKGYTAYWVAMILRFCRKLLAGAAPIEMTPKKSQSRIEGRTLRARREIGHDSVKDIGKINSVEVTKSYESPYKCQFAVILSLADLARACHLRKEDAAFALAELGFLQHRRARSVSNDVRKHLDPGEWKDMEVVVSREMVEELWVKWRVREKGVLSNECKLL